MDWKELVRSVSPALGAALGGPLAGAAIKILADKVLGTPDASEDDVAAALASGTLSGDQIVALKQAEQSFQLEMARIDQASDAAAMADVASARQQTVALAEAGSSIAWGAPVISTIIVVGFFLCVFMLFFRAQEVPPNLANLMYTMFGGLLVAFTAVVNYWLGSSSGSKRAGDTNREIATTLANKV